MSRKIISIHIALLSCLVNVLLTAQDITESQYTDIIPFINQHDIILSWDTMYNVGLLTKDSTVISFQTNFSHILVNFKTQYTVPPVIVNNERILVHKNFINTLETIFSLPKKTKIPSMIPPDTKSIYQGLQRTNFSNISMVVIDPGHGGKDPGAVGRNTYNGTSYTIMEKDVVLAVSLQVKEMLQQYFPKLTIVLTRDTDIYVSLEERTIIANKYLDDIKEREAILFISIHANAAFRPQASGYEVWYLPPEYRRNNLVSENIDNMQLYSIINSLREEEITLESIQLATNILEGMELTVGEYSRNRGKKEEQFYVVRNTKMPAVLIELGFLTNPKEGFNLLKKDYQNKLSVGVTAGIKRYIELFDTSQLR